jgi:hypothetical protein
MPYAIWLLTAAAADFPFNAAQINMLAPLVVLALITFYCAAAAQNGRLPLLLLSVNLACTGCICRQLSVLLWPSMAASIFCILRLRTSRRARIALLCSTSAWLAAHAAAYAAAYASVVPFFFVCCAAEFKHGWQFCPCCACLRYACLDVSCTKLLHPAHWQALLPVALFAAAAVAAAAVAAAAVPLLLLCWL